MSREFRAKPTPLARTHSIGSRASRSRTRK